MNILFKTLLSTVAITALTNTNISAQTFVIKSSKTITNQDAGAIDNGVVLIENGRIKALSVNTAQYKADTVIGNEMAWVTPGIFAPFSHLGLVEVSGEANTNDISAKNPKTGLNLHAIDSFNPHSTSVAISRVGGVTHAAIAQGAGSSIFGGIGTVVSTNGSLDISTSPKFVFVQLGQSGANTAGGSRSASLAQLRESLNDTANLTSRFAKSTHDGAVLTKYEASVLTDVLNGKLPLIIQADRAIDIANIIKLKRNRMRIIILGAAESWMVADKLRAANISVIIDPIENLPYNFDSLASRGDNAKLLKDAGVDFAIMARTATGANAHNLRLLTQHAGNAVANGLSWDAAFKAITLTPASMMGMNTLGKLQAGQKANLVVWSGDPLEVTSAPIAVFIDGELQSLNSRQTELAKRYNPIRTSTLPYGYKP